jgi:hypothetical protein
MRARSLVLPALLVASGCQALSHDCHDMGVYGGLNMAFEPELGAWGTWDFAMTGDVVGNCEILVPVDHPFPPANSYCEPDSFSIDVRDDGYTIQDLDLGGTQPESFFFTVLWETIPVFLGPIVPAYEGSEPNGPGCGEVQSATVIIDIPSPGYDG